MNEDFAGLNELADEFCSDERKIEILTEFKGHVKKTLVNEQACGKYFDNLSTLIRNSSKINGRGSSVNRSSNPPVLLLAHSALCYLIKRVAMQAQHKFQHDLIQQCVETLLLTSVSDKKTWQSTVKALEAIYLSKPQDFCNVLNEVVAENDVLRTKVLLLIDELARMEISNGRNASLFLQKFLPNWVQLMSMKDQISVENIELIFEIIANRCPQSVVRTMIETVTDERAFKILNALFLQSMKESGLSRNLSHDEVDDFETSVGNQNIHNSNADMFDLHEELQSIMNHAPSFPAVSSPQSTNYNNVNYLVKDLESISSPFESSKETEQNWKQRQANIIKLRSIIIGNVSQQFPDKFLELWKEMNLQDCVTKSVLSLRTSLCTHGCSLVKDLCYIFNAGLDTSIIEGLWTCLAKLMSNTKKIANQNANICIITLLSTVPYHSRLFNHCFGLIRSKNTTARLYSSTFLKILIIRFHKRLASQHHVYVEEWLQKGLTDAQTTIRESMRSTFWYWYKAYPISGKKMISLFQPQIKRALEANIPPHLDIQYDAALSSSSRDSSRRSSLLPKRFPSYAAPTQSSHLPRSSIKRSLTDLGQGSISTSATPSFAKRPLKTPPEYDMNIDLTSELTSSHTNPLLKRYMKNNETSEEEPLSSLLTRTPESGLEVLLQKLLAGTEISNRDSVEKFLIHLVRTSPKSFRPFLALSHFYQLLPLQFLLLLLSVNDLQVSLLDQYFPAEKVIDGVISILKSLEDKHSDWTVFYVRFKYQIYNFCFDTVQHFSARLTLSTELATELFNACGKDMDADKYYDTILSIYRLDPYQFLCLLKATPTAATKLKIANMIQRNDPTFKISSILNYTTAAAPFDTAEEKHLLEMTMVNPLGKRTISSNTVVHNTLDTDEENLPSAQELGRTSEPKITQVSSSSDKSADSYSLTRHGFASADKVADEGLMERHDVQQEPNCTENHLAFSKTNAFSKLTEMTKVHSVFQPEKVKENIDHMDIDSNLNDTNFDQKSLVGDIFSKNQSRDHSPSPMENQVLDDLTATEKQEYESNLLSDAINGMEIKTTTDGSFDNRSQEELEDIPEKKTESLVISKTVRPLDVEQFSRSSLIRYEMEAIDTLIEFVNLNTLIMIVDSITNNGTFKMNELQYILKAFLSTDEKVQSWIQQKDQLRAIWLITEQLLSSSLSEIQIPTNVTYQSIILTVCVLTADIQLGDTTITAAKIKKLVDNMTELVAKLDSYENEIYFVCVELRKLLLTNYPELLPAYLEKCLTGLCNTNEQYMIKITFLLESINVVVEAMSSLLSTEVLRNLAKTVSRYTPSDIVEWRFASCTVLASIYGQLLARSTPVGYIRSLMPLLNPSDFELVRSLSTMKNAST